MLVFVKNEKGRPEAQLGYHDDLVMCLAIAYYIRTQQDMTEEPEPEEEITWPFELQTEEESEEDEEIWW